MAAAGGHNLPFISPPGGLILPSSEVSLAHGGVLFLDELPESGATPWSRCASRWKRAK